MDTICWCASAQRNGYPAVSPWTRILLYNGRPSKRLAAGVDTAFIESVQSGNYSVVLPMLTLSYFLTRAAALSARSPARTPLPQVESPLAAISFGAANDQSAEALRASAIAIDAPLLYPSPNSAGVAAALLEVWHDSGASVAGQRGALHYCYNEHMLFGCIALAESAFAAVSADHLAAEASIAAPSVTEESGADQSIAEPSIIERCRRTALQHATAEAYRQIFALLDDCAFPHLWRVWNFIPQINAESNGLERYRQFNIDRQAAFIAGGRAVIGNVPAASAVGARAGALAIYFFAGRIAPLAIENPRQLSAYHYPSDYGPRSPLFARANLIARDDGEILFISGTASIVGHRTLHNGDASAQTAESLVNIDAILAAANAQAQRRTFARGDLAYKIYVRCAADLESVRGVFEAWLGSGSNAVYVQADICRAELLVEIEASAGHRMEPCTNIEFGTQQSLEPARA